jgi:hypothetical protein
MKKAWLGMMLLGLFLLGGGMATAQEAVIRKISGNVEVKAPGGGWVSAEVGRKLERSAQISTGFKSGALLAVGNSTITVRPLTRLTVEELTVSEGNELIDLNLRVGRVRAEVVPPPGRKTEFTVRSPMATASVRGTSFEFDGMRLNVEEGRVYISGQGSGGSYVGAGHGVNADTEGGKIAGAGESVREELALPFPAGVDNPPAVKAVPSLGGEIEAGFDWN